MKTRAPLKIAIVLSLFLPVLTWAQAVQVPTPVITPGSDSYSDFVTVSITAEAGATIYYTTDGSIPTAIPANLYAGPFTLEDSSIVIAYATKPGETDSLRASATYLITASSPPTPTVRINGKKSFKTTKTSVKIKGTATDNTSVEYQVGDGDFKTAKGTSPWSFKLKLKPGKNVIFVYAIGDEEDSDPAKVTVTLVKKK
jgi:hypothetical protein